MPCKALWHAILIIVAMSASPALAATECPINYGARADAKPNKLYLLFPAVPVEPGVDPSVFPPHGFNPATSWLPLPKFDTQELGASSGTPEQLRDAVHDVVADIFCEFNVQVITITSPMPAPTPAERLRHNTVGIGTDRGRPCNEVLFGQAGTAGGDPGDSKPRDFARVWAGSYKCADIPLDLEKWANSIGGTAAHEAGHNYGLSHEDGLESIRSHEDSWRLHLMRPAATDGGTMIYEYKDRAKRRHFSDFETSVLARNVGLAMDTMWTWDITNPNEETGAKLRMELLSTKPSLILSWAFMESTSPWINPTLSGPSGTPRVFKGKQYNVYTIEWSAGQPWSELSGSQVHPSGQVPRGARFQVGATFSSASPSPEPDATIIADVTLFDANDRPLPKRPHWMGFDAGTFDSDTGNLNVRFFNFLDRPLILRDVVIRDLPRIMSIKAMMREVKNDAMRDKPITDIFDRKFMPWDRWGVRRPVFQYSINDILNRELTQWGNPETQPPLFQYTIESGEEFKLPVANRKQGRHISLQRNHSDCTGRGLHDLNCHAGLTIDDLFPATTMYIRATVIDPATATAVTAAVESHLFYQIAGRRARLP